MRPVALLALIAACSCSLRTWYGDAGLQAPGHHHDEDARADAIQGGPGGEERHVHAAGERSECTAWLFTQPWVSAPDRVRVARDSLILLALAAVVRAMDRLRRG